MRNDKKRQDRHTGWLKKWIRLGGDDRYGLPRVANRRRYVRQKITTRNQSCITVGLVALLFSCATPPIKPTDTALVSDGMSRPQIKMCMAEGTHQELDCSFRLGELDCRLLLCKLDDGRIRQAHIDYTCHEQQGENFMGEANRRIDAMVRDILKKRPELTVPEVLRRVKWGPRKPLTEARIENSIARLQKGR